MLIEPREFEDFKFFVCFVGEVLLDVIMELPSAGYLRKYQNDFSIGYGRALMAT